MNTRRRNAGLGYLGVSAVCVACCAAPVATALGGVGLLSIIAGLWLPAMMGVAVVALVAAGFVNRRSRGADRDTTVADLGMPGNAKGGSR